MLNPIRAYAAVTAAYWAFMLTDGALRMLVLLQFNGLGFSAVQLAWLFLLYEVAGIATNLGAGWLAARFGLAATLYGGLGLQVAALIALTQLDPGWSIPASVAFVMAVQGVSGVAKDLAKMSSKSAVKLLAPSGDGGLFRWVAVLTGSKNAVKGLGFFLGSDPRLWRCAAYHPRCRFLLHGQCGGAADRHAFVGAELPARRAGAVPGHRRRHGGGKLVGRAQAGAVRGARGSILILARRSGPNHNSRRWQRSNRSVFLKIRG